MFQVPASSGITLARSLHTWLLSTMGASLGVRGGAGANVHVDAVPWPQNAPCAKLGVGDAELF